MFAIPHIKTTSNGVKLYELTYLMPLDLPENEVKSLQEKINSFIADGQGVLDRIEDVVKKRLGGPIKNQTAAQMGTLNFYIGPEKLADLEKKLKAENQIVRHVILHKKPRKAEVARRIRHATPVMAESSEKPAQEGRGSRPEGARLSPKNETAPNAIGRPKKVEIKEIEKKLEEILGE
ncbi:MAG: 30S ribosomal protein S6 [Patescibacteria group bacterium]